MRVLITGAAGFLGSHLTDALLAAGHSIIGVDNLCTGSLKNIEHLEREARFEFLEQDICQPFDPGHVDYVFNFASPASPVDYHPAGHRNTDGWLARDSTTHLKSRRSMGRNSCMPRRRNAMAIPMCIPKPKTTGDV